MKRRGPFAGGLGALALVVLIGVLVVAVLGPIDIEVGNDGDAQETAAPTSASMPRASAPVAVRLQGTTTAGPAGDAPAGSAAATTGGAMDAVAVVERVAPAVVTVNNLRQLGGFFGGDESQRQGTGTGFVIDEQGYIVTNEHVVRGGDEFEVVFANGEERAAELIGADPIGDLAVVRIEGDVPATVPLGDSNALKPGQPVLAIGSPLGTFTNTVTQGIVSALGRNGREFLPNDPCYGTYTNLIQHDAAINPGNSGGPLISAAGEVIGVNTLGIPQAQGLFFAVPASTVREITSKLIETGEAPYPFFGVGSVPVTDDLAAQEELPVDYGELIVELEQGGPAAEAGIEPGDIVLAVEGQRIDAQNSFVEVLFAHEPGETVEATVQRGEEQINVEVTLGARVADPQCLANPGGG